MSPNYIHPQQEEILSDNNGTKRTLSALYDALSKQGIDIQTIKSNIELACSRTLQMFAPLSEHQILSINGNKPISGKPFQILGIDILIDEALKAWVLEVNINPSLNIYFEGDYMAA